MQWQIDVDIDECTEFRKAMRMRTPAFVHGTLILLAIMLASTIIWASLTKANLIIEAVGTVRPSPTAGSDINEEISCEVGGKVEEVFIEEGHVVVKGDVLLRLSTQSLDGQISVMGKKIDARKQQLATLDEYERLLESESLAATNAARAELEAAIEEVEYNERQRIFRIRLAQLELKEAETNEKRARLLVRKQAIPQREFQEAIKVVERSQEKLALAKMPVKRKRLRTSESAVEFALRQAQAKQKQLKMTRETKVTELSDAQAELQRLELDHQRTVIRAPRNGMITSKRVRIGDLVKPGEIGIAISAQDSLHFEAYVPNSKVAYLNSGLPCRIKLDAYDFRKFGTLCGTLENVAFDSEMNATGQRNERNTTYRVKIAIAEDNDLGIKLGMAGRAEIVVGHESILTILLRKLPHSVSLGTVAGIDCE